MKLVASPDLECEVVVVRHDEAKPGVETTRVMSRIDTVDSDNLVSHVQLQRTLSLETILPGVRNAVLDGAEDYQCLVLGRELDNEA